MQSPTITDLEHHEARAWSDLYRNPPSEVADACGLDWRSLGSGSVCIASKIDVLAFNRTIGLGLTQRSAASEIDSLVRRYSEARAKRIFLQVSPAASVSQSRLEAWGFELHNHWVKLVRSTDEIPKTSTDLRIERIDRSRSGDFAEIVSQNLGWPDPVKLWVGCLVGRPGWSHYLVYDRDRPVGTGALFTEGRLGWIDFASTSRAYRGRGVQSALIARRIRDARAGGCEEVHVETAAARPGYPAISMRNVQRLGFRPVYLRPNYLLDLEVAVTDIEIDRHDRRRARRE